ncbi:UNVERIFIED_CONTAM: hypothetical protein Sradi_4134200 [Sesamum radiatum]|uniref:Aminotransferase-like plant mobile domain-containing protein n=1 Tax=Sesamum radiatum TaxID=300843 RepID=A0AAW2P1L3_SESRA
MSFLITDNYITSPNLCTLGRSIIEGDARWDGDLQFDGEFRYIKGYYEWIKDMLSRCRDRLRLINAYDVVYASLFTYDNNSNIIKAFCKAWCPFTNTLLTSSGELSISLWNLDVFVGFPMTGCLYDEVVPNALELTGIGEERVRLSLVPASIYFMLTACFKVLMIVDGPTYPSRNG